MNLCVYNMYIYVLTHLSKSKPSDFLAIFGGDSQQENSTVSFKGETCELEWSQSEKCHRENLKV